MEKQTRNDADAGPGGLHRQHHWGVFFGGGGRADLSLPARSQPSTPEGTLQKLAYGAQRESSENDDGTSSAGFQKVETYFLKVLWHIDGRDL